jgi:hypothetical protein
MGINESIVGEREKWDRKKIGGGERGRERVGDKREKSKRKVKMRRKKS